jgi:AraC-like DNA-binding protein
VTIPGRFAHDAGPRIAVALPAELEVQLLVAGCCGALHQLDPAGDCLREVDAVVVDPAHLCEAQRSLLTTLADETIAPYVFFTESTPAALEAVVALEALDPLQVVFAGTGDDDAQLRAAILDASRRVNPAALRRRLSPLLPALPPNLQSALDLLLRKPERFFDAMDVARHAGLSRRHVDRVLQLNGLAPAKRWVIAARVWHAVQLQRRKRVPLAEAARRLGYADAKALRRHRASLRDASSGSDTSDTTLDDVVAFLRATP